VKNEEEEMKDDWDGLAKRIKHPTIRAQRIEM